MSFMARGFRPKSRRFQANNPAFVSPKPLC
jgi:hypothetical protein